MQPGHAPTPFSAAEIAAACRPGRVNVYRITGEGRPPMVMRWEFTGGDDEQGEYATATFAEDGSPAAPPGRATARWVELQSHASTPADRTVIDTEEIDVPAGRFACWRYAVDEGGEQSILWFALDLPGPPVRRVGMRDGTEISSMTLIEIERPRA